MATHDVYTLPPDLPVPADGRATHLVGSVVPSVTLPATTGQLITPGDPSRSH
jgi:hypothetical protein